LWQWWVRLWEGAQQQEQSMEGMLELNSLSLCNMEGMLEVNSLCLWATDGFIYKAQSACTGFLVSSPLRHADLA
jgi:hypothetical protein